MLVKKNLPAKARDVRYTGWIPGWRRSPGGGHGNAVQYSLLENSMDRGAWKVMVLRFAKSQTWLKWLSMHAEHIMKANILNTSKIFSMFDTVDNFIFLHQFAPFIILHVVLLTEYYCETLTIYILYRYWSLFCAKSLQSYLTLYDPVDHSLPGSSVHGILQARILDWVALFSSRGSSTPRYLMPPALAGGFFITSTTWEALLAFTTTY